jgi:hypothetical protein
MRRVLVALCAAAVVVGGCGSDEKRDYVKKVNSLQEQRGLQIAQAANGYTGSGLAGVVRRQATAITGAARDIGAVKAPKRESAFQQQFVEVLKSYAGQLQSRPGDAAAVASATSFAQQRLQASVGALNRQLTASSAPILVADVTLWARGSSSHSSGGSSSSSHSSSPSKSSYSGSSASRSSSSPSKPATASKPSTGSKPQPSALPKLIPPASGAGAASKFAAPRYTGGRNYTRDRDFIIRNPRYGDPYRYGRSGYYGSYNSPYFYLWSASYFSGRQRPLPPSSDDLISQALLSYIGLIGEEAKLTRSAK